MLITKTTKKSSSLVDYHHAVVLVAHSCAWFFKHECGLIFARMHTKAVDLPSGILDPPLSIHMPVWKVAPIFANRYRKN